MLLSVVVGPPECDRSPHMLLLIALPLVRMTMMVKRLLISDEAIPHLQGTLLGQVLFH